MIIITRRKFVTFLFFSILFVAALVSHDNNTAEVFSGELTKRIIIDAGHGFPDGGAVGARGTIECTLNLKIAKRIEKELKKKGYTVIMTRTGEDSPISGEDTISNKKHKDMYRRLGIINNSEADLFVSIHMNKFGDSRYRGAQVIYSGNFTQSHSIAQLIQEELNFLPENFSKRTQLKAPQSIFLLKKAEIPAVIVECGFLSNFEEEELLQTPKYQQKLSKAIVKGIEKYYKTERKDSSL